MATRSRPTEKWGPLAAITTARTSGRRRGRPWPRGRSSQKAGPMALRFSGRSSHSVATWPSTSMVRTSELNGVDGGSGSWSPSVGRRTGSRRSRRTRQDPAGPGGRWWRTGSMRHRGSSTGPRSARGPDPAHLHPRQRRRPAGRPLAGPASHRGSRGLRLVTAPDREGRGLAVQPHRPARPRPVPPGWNGRRPGRRRRPLSSGSTPWWTASGPGAAWWSRSTASWPPWPPRSGTT